MHVLNRKVFLHRFILKLLFFLLIKLVNKIVKLVIQNVAFKYLILSQSTLDFILLIEFIEVLFNVVFLAFMVHLVALGISHIKILC